MLNFKNFKIFNTLKIGSKIEKADYFINDLDVFCTIAITPKYSQFNLNNAQAIESISLAVHLDFVKQFECCINKNLLTELSTIINDILEAFTRFNLNIRSDDKPKNDTEYPKQEFLSNISKASESLLESSTNSYSSFSITEDSQFDLISSSSSVRFNTSYKTIRIKNVKSKFKIWIQTTITKLIVNINDDENKLEASMEDITAFFDLNHNYRKFSLKLGSFDFNQYAFNNNTKEWNKDKTNNTIILTSLNHLNEELFITGSKINSNSKHMHTGSILNITYTSAKCANFNKKFYSWLRRRRLSEKDPNGEETGDCFDRLKDKFKIDALKSSSKTNWISELNFSLKRIDFIYQPSIFKLLSNIALFLIQVFDDVFNHSLFNQIIDEHANSNQSFSIPIIETAQIPLLNLEIGRARFILPILIHKNNPKVQSTIDENIEKKSEILVFQCIKTNITSKVENPLNRNLYECEDVFEEAKVSEFLYKPGFCFEDRQYSITLNGLSLFLSSFSNLIKNNRINLKLNEKESYMNPAAMWNSLKNIDTMKEVDFSNTLCGITPVVDIFDLNSVVGLPICYFSAEKELKTLISGYVFETNVNKSYLNFFISPTLLNAVYEVIQDNMLLISQLLTNIEKITKTKNTIDFLKYKPKLIVVPFEFLITTEKINFSIYNSNQLIQSNIQPIFFIEFHQPFLSIIVNRMQLKIEVSIFNFSVSHIICNILENNDLLKEKKIIFTILESKVGKSNSKTGISSSFLSFKLNTDYIQDTHYLLENIHLYCNKCTKSYSYDKNFVHNDIKQIKPKNIIELLFERPFRIQTNKLLLKQLDKLLSGLDLFIQKKETLKANNEIEPENLISQNFLLLKIRSSQIVLKLELINENCIFQLNLGSIKFDMNYMNNLKNNKKLCFNNPVIYVDSKIENISLNYFNQNSNQQFIFYEVIRPFFLSMQYKYHYTINENFVSLQCDQISLNISKNIVENIELFQHSINKYQEIFLKNKFTRNDIHEKKIKINSNSVQYEIKEDDMRNNNFSFFINNNPEKNELDLQRMMLPSSNQIMVNQHNSNNFKDHATICWRYDEMRSIIFACIQPISFLNSRSSVKNKIDLELNDSKNDFGIKIKCYLEFLNECTNSFETVKEVFIKQSQFITIIDFKNELKNIKNYSYLPHAFIWRLRLSKESLGFIDVTSLLAGIRIDSIIFKRSNNDEIFKEYFHIEAAIQCININHFTFQKNIETAIAKFIDNKIKTIYLKENDLISINFCLLGKLSIDYIDYRFLTMCPLLESTTFKTSANYIINKNNNTQIDSKISIEALHLNISQSCINSLKIVSDHWKKSDKESENTLINETTYLIINETDFILHIKQFETEETIILYKGNQVNYSWRTHKKMQLLQIFIPEYKTHSTGFTIDQIDTLELLLDAESKAVHSFQIVLLVLINEINGYKKNITIQSNFLICNFLNFYVKVDIQHNFDINANISSKLEPHSRSIFTYNLNKELNNLCQLQNINIYNSNDKLIISFKNLTTEQLKEGILCVDNDDQIKFWMTLFEQNYKNKKSKIIVQTQLLFSPLVIICSYLPLSIKLNILSNDEKKAKMSRKPLAKSH